MDKTAKKKTKKKANTTLTAKSLKLLRDEGYMVCKVEYWNSFAFKRKDLFGIIDVLCMGNGKTFGVQVTSESGISARVKKMLNAEWEGQPTLKTMLYLGWEIEIHGWHKVKNRWQVRRVNMREKFLEKV